MLSIQEREHRKIKFAKRGDNKLYEDLYAIFAHDGYSKDLADQFADTFVNDQKKPAPHDIVQAARLYDKINDLKSAAFYLGMLEDKKLSNDERFAYCTEALKNKGKIGNWRDAEDFRTENISFLQKYADKADMQQKAELYIALALVDCAAKHYNQGFRLLTNFGYKPKGKNDVTLLELLITAVYICARSGDEESLDNAVNNARSALGLFKVYPFIWSEEYYEKCIVDAANGII